MPERFEILFRPEVERDLRPIGRLHQRRILSAIESRLALEPVRYGKPLGGSLAGLRRIRVGDFRIAYQVKGGQVIVWAIVHRKEIYAELARRFSRS
ncbi:MAG TPA: type II toxin-antitoxin system RelE/ParE family toxin [Elusimicrobiota bacterium]|nr:type II toxin-antitoxin system RelE/ParE family toxin [Elusimicrobiota bacterium]